MGQATADNPTDAMAPSESAVARGPDLGVLLVHGIGNHKQGETLNEFAAPIVKWIDRWLVRDERVEHLTGQLVRRVLTKDFVGEAKFTRGTLRPPDLPLDTPAHARAAISLARDRGPKTEQSWLFAESWWSPQTLTPRVSPFLLWLITRGPWLMLLHLSQSFGLDYKALLTEMQQNQPATYSVEVSQVWKSFKFFAVTVVWLTISLLLIALWCVVSLIALVPIGYVRQRVYALLLAVTGVVGDSYVLINDPIQRVAFANSARRGLAWLSAQGCRKLAVVAHSQGAAVARDVLLENGAQQVDLFVTLGPGIAKLDALAERERMEPQSFMWSGAAAPLTVLALASFVRLQVVGESGFALWGFPALVGILAIAAIFLSWHYVGESLERLKPGWPEAALMRGYQPRMRWRDFYASHDPVSNGSLSATIAANMPWIVSRKVMVLASRLGDHTAYWTSRADFVPRVVAALEFCAGTGLFATRLGVRRLRRARRIHRRWVRCLWLTRWVGVAALVMPVFAFDRVLAVARTVHDGLEHLPIASISGAVQGLDTALGWIATRGAGQEVGGQGVTAVLLLASLAAAVLYVWGRIVAYWWQHTASLLMTPVFTPSRDHWAGRFGQWLLVAWVATLAALPPALSGAWTFFPQVVSWDTLLRFIGMFATLACMVGYVGLLLGLITMTREFAGNLRAALKTQPTFRAAVKSVPDLWVVPFNWLLFGAGGGFLLWQNRYTPELWGPAAVLVATGAVAHLSLRWKAR